MGKVKSIVFNQLSSPVSLTLGRQQQAEDQDSMNGSNLVTKLPKYRQAPLSLGFHICKAGARKKKPDSRRVRVQLRGPLGKLHVLPMQIPLASVSQKSLRCFVSTGLLTLLGTQE